MGLISKGWDAWKVSKAMNHSDMRITEHYIKMMDKEIDGAYGRGEDNAKIIKKSS